MSVLDKSCFSYHVAAGRTTSECSVVDVLRKSAVHMRSSLPGGVSSRQRMSVGRLPSGSSVALTSFSQPSMCFMKNSVPLALEPSRLVRQLASSRG